MLALQILLAFGLLLQLIDGGEIDLAEARHFRAQLVDLVLPRRHARIRRQALGDLRQLVLGGRELFGQRLAPHAALLRRHARLLDGIARLGDPRFGGGALLIQDP